MTILRPFATRFLLVLALSAWSLVAFGRAGGGESYSGGGGGYSSGSDYGGSYGGGSYGSGGMSTDVHAIFIILLLVVVCIFIGILIQNAEAESKQKPEAVDRRPRVDAGLRALRELDPDFSVVAFKDFAHGLYHEVHHRRGLGQLENLNPYLAAPARNSLQALSPDLTRVDQVVVGTCMITAVGSRTSPRTKIVVRFEANYLENQGSSGERYYAAETWTFVRPRGVRSKPPQILVALGCPKCGAPRGEDASATCRSCGVAVTDHDFGWSVSKITTSRHTLTPRLSNYAPDEVRRPRPPDEDLEDELATYKAEHPSFILDKVLGRAADIFIAVQEGWSARQPRALRPYLTDSLFESYRYWLEEHERQGVRNRLSEIKIHDLIPLSLQSDVYYTSLTVRVDASLIDTFVDENERVIDGDWQSPRGFTEYWTFIKGTASRLDAVSPIDRCPACGAALKIGMTGVCAYCQTRITTGDFDWILSAIEQE